MKAKPYTLLLHPLFLLSLFLLLSNDLYLKYQFHNDITGKLSDVTGLFVFGVFFTVFFSGHKKTVLLVTALLFIAWKSPWSDPLIAFINNQFHLPVHRVVDYSDLLALLVLPLVLYLRPVYYPPSFIRRVAVTCSCILSFISFTATSMIRRATDNNRVSLEEYIRAKKSKKEIIHAIEADGMKPQPLPALYDKVWNYNLYLKVKDSTGAVRMVAIDSLYNGTYTKLDYGSAYTIPKVYVDNDSVTNLELIISDIDSKKNLVRLHSFQYGKDTSTYFPSYTIYKRFKKPLRRKFKALLK